MGRLSRVFAHSQHAVDFAALLNQQTFGRHVAMDDARRLQFHTLFGVDRTADLAADNCFATDDVAFHFPAPGDEDLFGGADGAADGAFDLDDAIRGDVAYDAHPRTDDGESRHSFARAAAISGCALFAEHRHQCAPPSSTSSSGSIDLPSWRISKCRCGAVDRPVFPDRPMTCP